MAFEFDRPITAEELQGYLDVQRLIIDYQNMLTGKHADSIIGGLINVMDGFQGLALAALEKGADLTDMASLEDLADAIRGIPTGGADWVHIEDGKTRLYIDLPDGYTAPILGAQVSGTIDIDWGDGTEHDTLTGDGWWASSAMRWTPRHQYSKGGKYCIIISGGGSFSFVSATGVNILRASSALRYSDAADPRNVIYNNSVIGVDCGTNFRMGGQGPFAYCNRLKRVYITDNSTTDIRIYAFRQTTALEEIRLPVGYTLANAVFEGSGLLGLDVQQNSGEFAPYLFESAPRLQRAIVPDGCTSIGAHAFYSCPNVIEAVIPASVTRIESSAFFNLTACCDVRFLGAVPPVLASSNVFSYLPASCVIHVPKGTLNAYKTATNYPSAATYTYVEDNT